jgi:hypothetical protein
MSVFDNNIYGGTMLFHVRLVSQNYLFSLRRQRMDQQETVKKVQQENGSGLRIDPLVKESEKIPPPPVVKLPDHIKEKIPKSVEKFFPKFVHPESYFKDQLMVSFTSDTVKST